MKHFDMLPHTQQENVIPLIYQSLPQNSCRMCSLQPCMCLHLPTIWSQWLIIYEKLKSLKLSQRLGSCCRLFRVKIIKQISVVEFSSGTKLFFYLQPSEIKAEVIRNFWDNLTMKMSLGLKEKHFHSDLGLKESEHLFYSVNRLTKKKLFCIKILIISWKNYITQ